MSGLTRRLVVIAGGLLLLALGPRPVAEAQTKKPGLGLQTFYLRTTQGWKPVVGVSVRTPAGVRLPLRLPHGLPKEIADRPTRLPHGLGEVGNLPVRLPHGLGEVGNLPRRLPHGLGEVGNLPKRLPHGLPKEIGDLPAQLRALPR
jgi:hypothetical protein